MLFLTEKDVQTLRQLYEGWLEDALSYEREGGGCVTSFTRIVSEVKRVEGKITRETVKDWLKGLPLSVPFVTADIVSMSLASLSSVPLVLSYEECCENPLHIDNTYGRVLLCHKFSQDDYEELDEFYWGLLTEIVLEGAAVENK